MGWLANFIGSLGCLIVFLGQAACQGGPKKAADTVVVAKVREHPISAEALSKALLAEGWKYGLEADSPKEAVQKIKWQLLESLIQDRLLLLQAETVGIQVSPEELSSDLQMFQNHYQSQEWLEILKKRGWTLEDWQKKRREQLVIQKLIRSFAQKTLPPTRQEIAAYYRAHTAQFREPEQVRLRQMVTDSREKAETLRQKALAGENFATLVQQHSISPDKQKEGDLGYFSRGSMPPEFDAVGFALKPGEISSIVASEYGYHIFQGIDRKAARQLPLKEVSKTIEQQLTEEKANTLFQEWYERQRKEAAVTVQAEAVEALQIPSMETEGSDEH